ncbi:MAG: sigma-70 family RNA polymerase sigma factor [Planctomycetota bacterium]
MTRSASGRPSPSESAIIRTRLVRLLEQHRPMLAAYAFALTGDHHTAEDAVQEAACIAALDPRRIPDAPQAAAGWLRAVVRRKALELGRKARGERRQLRPEVVELVAASFDEVESDSSARRLERMRRAMAACVERLSERARKAVRARYVERASCASIAERCGLRVDQVYTLLKRSRSSLIRCVDQQLELETP